MFVEQYIGMITPFAGNYAPAGWMLCNGQLLGISGNEPLFSLIGTTYGGDGLSNFALPNLCGSVAIHAGQGSNLQLYELGQAGGNASVTLTANNLPVHTHQVLAFTTTPPPCNANPGDTDIPVGNYPAQLNAASAAYSTAASANIGNTTLAIQTPACVGGATPIPMMSPYQVMNYIICTEGIWPSQG